MENLIDWIIDMLSRDGINSKGLVKTTLEEMTLDDWYILRDTCNDKIVEARRQGHEPESNKNVLLLKSYQSDVYQCSLLKREIEGLSNFVKSPNYDGMPFNPSNGNSVEKQHIELIGAKHKLEKLLLEKSRKLVKCLKLIDIVNDDRSRYILTGIFIENKNLYQIMSSAPFELSYKQICRLKKAGLDQIRKFKEV